MAELIPHPFGSLIKRMFQELETSNSIFDYSNNFMDEINSHLLEYKNSKDFETQIRVFLGKSFSDSEISELIKRDDKGSSESGPKPSEGFWRSRAFTSRD